MMAVGNDELGKSIPDDARVQCHICGRAHKIQYGKSQNGEETRLLAFYRCGKSSYVCGIAGRLLPGEELAKKEKGDGNRKRPS
jgi:hypothetical protein